MASSICVSHLVAAVTTCLIATMLTSCQSTNGLSVASRRAQCSEVIYASAPPRPHEFAFEARPPGHPRVPAPDGPGMDCLHHVATSLAIAGRIPLALGAGVVGFGMSGYRAKVGVGVAGWVLDQPLP